MTGPDPHTSATAAAETLIRNMAGAALPIDPFAVSRGKGIDVLPKAARDAGVSGMLIRVGNHFSIGYATHIDNVPFQRFCVAHELGHYFLPGHPEGVLDAYGVHESHAGFRSTNRYEIEADRFAAGLLMPRHLFGPALAKAGQGLAAVETLARLCQTSRHATAIRFAQCSPDPVAIIVSVGDRIDHCFMSDELKTLDGIDWLRKREALPRTTATFAFNKDSSNIQTGARADGTSNLQDWFGGRYDIEVTEDVIGLGSYGKTLTILYEIALPDEQERADEDALQESWTPKFRR
jgi:Zn-dependent peptidase ImmA (M78 family)